MLDFKILIFQKLGHDQFQRDTEWMTWDANNDKYEKCMQRCKDGTNRKKTKKEAISYSMSNSATVSMRKHKETRGELPSKLMKEKDRSKARHKG